ncbi:MAG: hypothetical protein R8N50_03910 [Alphaproteobacteria bacterium]|nr:hypothetical protein [Alphaproteobacteria bacterium]
MNKIYFLVFLIVVLVGAYFAGGRVANEKCRARLANSKADQQLEIVKLHEAVNEEVFSRGVGDIRRVLRERYTIAQ